MSGEEHGTNTHADGIGVPPQPMVAPAAPPVAQPTTPVPGVYPAQAQPVAPARRSNAWIWWTLGIAVFMFAVVGSCMALVIAGGGGFSEGDTGFGDAVAVIHVNGVIAGTGSVFDGIVTPEYLLDQLDQARDDERVKAVVLRVDSPGGTVAASQEVSAYVAEFTELKPVVVSVGDVDASGAYMMSSQADQIYANPGSAVGSIGVIAEIPNVEGLLDKVGVEFQVITAGELKDTGSPYRPLSDRERSLIQGSIDQVYEQFIDTVAEGREMKRSEVETLATGWAWNGSEAVELGLVDEIGTYRDALDAAADLGGIEGEYEIVTYEDYSAEDFLWSILGVSDRIDPLEALGVLRGQPQMMPR